ncbi:MAG: hypothetical protein M3Y18_02275 [Candidatus Eremiobacteraeota bacterium]|nr:hypothetical protein [Candidatus Eremiobacteraeota bacterium]
MTDKNIYEDDREESASGDALNQSGTQSSSGGNEGAAPDGDVIGKDAETDNEGRVAQRSNTDV